MPSAKKDEVASITETEESHNSRREAKRQEIVTLLRGLQLAFMQERKAEKQEMLGGASEGKEL